MEFNFTKKWFDKAIKLEGNSNVSAGWFSVPRKFAGLRISGEDLRVFVDKLYGYSNPRSVRLMEYPIMQVNDKGEFTPAPCTGEMNLDGENIIQATSKVMPEHIYNIIDILRYIVDTDGSGIPTRIYLRTIFDSDKTRKRYARYAVFVPKVELP
jgi:hypothetical protein